MEYMEKSNDFGGGITMTMSAERRYTHEEIQWFQGYLLGAGILLPESAEKFKEIAALIESHAKHLQELEAAAGAAIDLCVQYGGIDGAHHKDWVMDQMVRKLAGERYEQIVKDACVGEDGPNTYTWDCGIAP
jgi:DNA mismatch repair ATPase MutS